jgi:hypothetical protein
MSVERLAIITSLCNVSFFYFVTLWVFLIARKNRLNYSLASQKAVWLLVILLIALPLVWFGRPLLPMWARAIIWGALTPISWWVLYEVYRANSWVIKRWLCTHQPFCKLARIRGKC